MDIVRTLATSVLFAIVLAQENPVQIKKAGMLGHSVKLPCRIPPSQSPKVRWEDTVHTSSHEPIVIFQSQNNPNFTINAAHPNAANYKVDKSNFDLKISKLTVDDVGSYTCISEQEQTVHRQDYYLLIYGYFKCSGGESQLSEGDSLSLNCQVTYSGDQPSVSWFIDDELVDSIDRSDLVEAPIAAKELPLNASHDLDGKTIRCQMMVADRKENCTRVLNVTYPVRDIGFVGGDMDNFYVGEEVTCTARGNPTPVISLVPTSLDEEVEDRKKSSIIIPSNWVGKDVVLECTARNTYKGEERVERTSKSIHVLEATTTTTTTTTTTPAPSTTTMKPKVVEPGKPVDGSHNASAGERLAAAASWKGFPLILLSMTLMKLPVF